MKNIPVYTDFQPHEPITVKRSNNDNVTFEAVVIVDNQMTAPINLGFIDVGGTISAGSLSKLTVDYRLVVWKDDGTVTTTENTSGIAYTVTEHDIAINVSNYAQ